MVWVGRDLKAHNAISPPAMGRAAPPHQLRLPRTPSDLTWRTSRDGAPQLLWAAVPGLHCPLSKEFLPNVYPTFLLFQFKAIPPCPLTVSPCIKSVSRVYCNAAVRSLQTLLQADQAHLPQPVCKTGSPALWSPLWPSLDSLQQLHVFSELRAPGRSTPDGAL